MNCSQFLTFILWGPLSFPFLRNGLLIYLLKVRRYLMFANSLLNTLSLKNHLCLVVENLACVGPGSQPRGLAGSERLLRPGLKEVHGDILKLWWSLSSRLKPASPWPLQQPSLLALFIIFPRHHLPSPITSSSTPQFWQSSVFSVLMSSFSLLFFSFFFSQFFHPSNSLRRFIWALWASVKAWESGSFLTESWDERRWLRNGGGGWRTAARSLVTDCSHFPCLRSFFCLTSILCLLCLSSFASNLSSGKPSLISLSERDVFLLFKPHFPQWWFIYIVIIYPPCRLCSCMRQGLGCAFCSISSALHRVHTPNSYSMKTWSLSPW